MDKDKREAVDRIMEAGDVRARPSKEWSLVMFFEDFNASKEFADAAHKVGVEDAAWWHRVAYERAATVAAHVAIYAAS